MAVERQRYTPNDVGPSPVEWDTPKLKEVSTLITNGFVGVATPFYTDETGVRYLYGTNVRRNKIDPKGIRYVTEEFHLKHQKTSLRKGDLLTVQSGHIGETAVVTDEYVGSNCHALIVSRLKQQHVDPEFLAYYFNSEIGQARMRGLFVGSTIAHINTNELKEFRLLLPTIGEQRAIAEILSTWDKSIEATERLLENSKKRKKALMQRLLTGKTRLRGFSEEWKEIEIGELCEIYDGTHQTPNYVEEGIPFFSVEHLTAGKFSETKFIEKVIFDKESEKKKIRRGDILMTRIGDIGTVKLVDWDFESTFYVSLALIRVYGEISPEFLSYYIKGVNFQRELWQRTIHVAFPKKINLGDIGKCKIGLPPLNEQLRICEILRPFFHEEDLINKKLEILRQQKIALMQLLLTGKKRVKVEKAA